MPNKAFLRIDKAPVHRYRAFYEGLQTAGYMVDMHEPRRVNPGDVLVVWNKNGTNETYADCFERGGGTVIVAENGYIGRDFDGNQLYALALKGHNGSGIWNVGSEDRFKELGVKFKPWRVQGEHILICPNRHIGSKLMRMPRGFVEFVTTRLSDLTKRPIRIRPHPGNWQVNPPSTPIEHDLANAWACIIWSSAAGIHALVEGIPVIYLAPYWIASEAASHDLSIIENPALPDRLPAFQKLAWAQWTLHEINSGEAFRCLLA